MDQNKPRSRKKVVSGESKGVRRRGEGLSKQNEHAQSPDRASDNRMGGAEQMTRGILGDLAKAAAIGMAKKVLENDSRDSDDADDSEYSEDRRSSESDPFGVSARDDENIVFGQGGQGGSGQSAYSQGGSSAGRNARKGGCLKYILFILILVVIFVAVTSLMQKLQSQNKPEQVAETTQETETQANASMEQVVQTVSQGNGVQTGWAVQNATEQSEESAAATSPEAREKFTKILGDGEDVATILIYMCGTDLESQAGMGTNDLNEMLQAEVGDKMNLVIFTGGCARWRNSVISSDYNQIYQINNGQLYRLVENAGTDPMTDPETLRSFVEWGVENFPANRYSLILWDHGTGSVNGYAYDEKYPRSGQMTLEEIDRALTASGTKFDFVGFDACLMATVETALMLGDNADYMIASEEVEPGIGWYYTDWLTAYSRNTSMPTVDIGRNIADTFKAQCAKQTPGQSTTLSVVDLAELSQTLPPKMKAFSNATSTLIDEGEFAAISRARSSTKEFARGQNLDQIDMVHFAKLLNTSEGNELAETILSAVKYNIASRDVANAYGLSIYFPYNSVRSVDIAKVIYKAIGMDDSYSDLLTRFATYQASGQAVSGGYSSPFYQLFEDSGQSGQSQQYDAYGSMDYQDMYEILGLLLGGRMGEIPSLDVIGLSEDSAAFLSDGEKDVEKIAKSVSENRISEEDITWKKDASDNPYLELSGEKWAQISRIDMSAFIDDGEGFIDMGLDNVYSFEGSKLIPEVDGTWIAINGQPMAYYHAETLDLPDGEYTIKGRVPVLLNGKRADLIIVFDHENELGYVAGSTYDYDDDVTTAIPKNLGALEAGDKLEFIANCYNYDGSFDDKFVISDEMVIDDPAVVEITNVDIKNSGSVKVMYCLTDIYGQKYWTKTIPLS